ncbi:S8 family serine peptidase [Longispora urticae]
MTVLVRAGIAALVLSGGLTAGVATPAAAAPAPLLRSDTGEIAGRYVVVLKRPDQGGPRSGPEQALAGPLSTARESGGTVLRRFSSALRGFSADLPPAALTRLRADPTVSYVQSVRLHRMETARGTQPSAPWHLDRIDQRNLPLDTSYTHPGDAAGTHVYVVDSGVRAGHAEFEGRATGEYTAINDGNGTNDCAGHGTFVASHVGGKTYGVAKKATLHAVRVLRCDNSASTDEIVDGMDWTAAHAVRPAVVNLSIQSGGGDSDPAMDDAARGLVDGGLLVVLIAGNFNRGDCQNSPKDPRAITMGATDRADARNTAANASSYGPCVTAFAPGADVTGAAISSDTATVGGFYGTSFAAPLAAGAVALALHGNPALTMAQAKAQLLAVATKDVLTDLGTGSPNRLLFVTAPGPTVTRPADQDSPVGAAASLQIRATDPQGDALTHTATGLPDGLTINPTTGLISGTPTEAGTATVTVTATDPGGEYGTATFAWTTRGCLARQLVGNPGFEDGAAPWTGDTVTIGHFLLQRPHAGHRVAWLGGHGRADSEHLSQQVRIAAGCTATLTYHLHVDTYEWRHTADDTLTVTFGGTAVAGHSDRDARSGYVRHTVDLSALAGTTGLLTFTATEDSRLQTSFVLDDVTLTTA